MTMSFLVYTLLLVAVTAIVAVAAWKISAASARQRCETESLREQQALETERLQSVERQAWLETENRRQQETVTQLKQEQEMARQQIQSLELELARSTERLSGMDELRTVLRDAESRLQQLQGSESDLRTALAARDKEREAADDKIRLLEQSEVRLNQQFENLANRIFEAKATRFTEQNKMALDGLLGPFKQQISDFRQQVNDAYVTEAKERRSLRDEVLGLRELNQQMSQEALNLTRALKGDKKAQGNWGELVLDRVLEESGLREGHEYERQVSLKNTDGERLQPDVVVHLPDGKDVVIDSKVSLVDYSRYHEAEEDAERNRALAAHVQCLRNHIRGLSAKSYQDLDGVRTLDYVLMFIPVEPAFYAAVEHQPSLFQEALEHNIMLVSPTNLLVALRTIENIWRYEHQNRNAEKIAEKASALYDKLRGFTDDMQKLGSQLDTAKKTYDGAMNKFSAGRGNLVRQAQQFVELGVKVKKQLPQDLLDRSVTEISAPVEEVELLEESDKNLG
ncbi:DNA recombination protein RmuC [Kistimonas asteriae]|uniref:DNA recombination protein RmuC n=1 Tax=Kistimonas asteriae TaxID=517724 RepID=UPI001BA659EE|nr:DNA recombination protein RmuC [Kistimonas asteriae]